MTKKEGIEILNNQEFNILLTRLSQELIENHDDFSNSAIIGIQPRGIYLANNLKIHLENKLNCSIQAGHIDTTFYRDDFRRNDKPLLPSITNLDFSVENKRIILVDDVLFTGRTVRAAMDAILAYGRPSSIELLVLIDRRFRRNLPIQADYTGKWVDTLSTENVIVQWDEENGFEKVILTKKQTLQE